jgi:hypothetical protein
MKTNLLYIAVDIMNNVCIPFNYTESAKIIVQGACKINTSSTE